MMHARSSNNSTSSNSGIHPTAAEAAVAYAASAYATAADERTTYILPLILSCFLSRVIEYRCLPFWCWCRRLCRSRLLLLLLRLLLLPLLLLLLLLLLLRLPRRASLATAAPLLCLFHHCFSSRCMGASIGAPMRWPPWGPSSSE